MYTIPTFNKEDKETSLEMDIPSKEILIIEPFYGGSHKKMLDVFTSYLEPSSYHLLTMTPKKWPWRARTSALYISLQIPKEHKYKILFCTSVLPLAELLGLRPDLVNLLKIVYFHENQLVYPVRVTKERDYQYGYNEILSCLTADKVLFNSNFNKTSFLSNIKTFLKIQPDYKIKNLNGIIEEKCYVVYYPLDFSKIDTYVTNEGTPNTSNVLHIIWPHRWEFDKDPDSFYKIICKLQDHDLNFKVSILGESFSQKPGIFEELKKKLGDKILHCGFVESESEYYKVLTNGDVVLSTAIHEFFGVSVMEAIYCGCIPVVPNRLVYKELYEGHVDELYNEEKELFEILSDLCRKKAIYSINKNYKHLVLPYDSSKWIKIMIDLMNLDQYIKPSSLIN